MAGWQLLDRCQDQPPAAGVQPVLQRHPAAAPCGLAAVALAEVLQGCDRRRGQVCHRGLQGPVELDLDLGELLGRQGRRPQEQQQLLAIGHHGV